MLRDLAAAFRGWAAALRSWAAGFRGLGVVITDNDLRAGMALGADLGAGLVWD